MELLVFGLASAVALAIAAYAISRARGLGEQFERARDDLAAERARAAEAESKANELAMRAVEAETRIGVVGAQLVENNEARETLAGELETAKEARREAEKQTALARQEIDGMKARMADWETTKEEAMKAANAAVLKTANVVSSKLLDDHKREAVIAKEDGEKRVKDATGKLLSEFDRLSKVVSSLGDRVEDNSDAVDIIERALSNPVGAGLAAETMLENTLKSFGLTPDMDYVLQPSVGGEGGARLRPDALVFMPGDAVLVIDSKASKYLLELAQADGEGEEDEIYAKLSDTMNQHLRDLAGKNYRNAVQAHYRSAGRADEVRQFINIMWLPNDAAVEKVRIADPEFLRKAWGHGIMVVGPTGLWTAIGMAKMNINLGRQAENRDKIVESVHALIESVAVMLDHAGGIGRSLRTAANFNVKLSGSINSRVLPRMRKLIEQGIESPTKGLPNTVPSYQVVDIEMADVIDTESDLLEPVRELPAPAGE